MGMDEPFDLSDMGDAGPLANGGPAAARAISELPSPDTKRWVVRRKAVVVQAVRNGAISLQEACRRYNLSVEEFLAWQARHSQPGDPEKGRGEGK